MAGGAASPSTAASPELHREPTASPEVGSSLDHCRDDKTTAAAQRLTQAAHGDPPSPTETTVQLPENRVTGLRGEGHPPGPSGCLPVPFLPKRRMFHSMFCLFCDRMR